MELVRRGIDHSSVCAFGDSRSGIEGRSSSHSTGAWVWEWWGCGFTSDLSEVFDAGGHGTGMGPTQQRDELLKSELSPLSATDIYRSAAAESMLYLATAGAIVIG